jgi:flagellar biosynthesis/type III secretory pathway protein FliH
MITKHSRRLDQKESEVAAQIRQLALAIAKKIVGKELEFNPEAVVDMAKKHLQSIRQRKEVYLRVCPADLNVLRDHKRDLVDQLGRAKDIELRSDETLTPGSMIIETDAGTIDARLETQMQVIERVLMGKPPV